MGLQTGLEDSHGRCTGGDVLRQTVPDTSGSDWKSSVADGGQSGPADDQSTYQTLDSDMTSTQVVNSLRDC